jgi:hypothetical protein
MLCTKEINEKTGKIIISLKSQIEKAKKIEEVLRS